MPLKANKHCDQQSETCSYACHHPRRPTHVIDNPFTFSKRPYNKGVWNYTSNKDSRLTTLCDLYRAFSSASTSSILRVCLHSSTPLWTKERQGHTQPCSPGLTL